MWPSHYSTEFRDILSGILKERSSERNTWSDTMDKIEKMKRKQTFFVNLEDDPEED